MASTLFRKAEISYPSARISLKFSVACIITFHFFGALGMLYPPTRPYFEAATPLNLLITNVLLFNFHRDWNLPFLIFCLISFLTGFLVEVAGVQTGLIFGEYSYGPALGLKLWEVPLLIGLNWLMLVYITGYVSGRLFKNKLLAAMGGTTLMVMLDYVIEPVAMKYNFWYWEQEVIPIQNYLGWFVTALFLHLIYQFLPFNKRNILAKYVIIVQLAFFISLHLFN
ncbi:MAG: carotenoid biosynthesis protein [Cyclobacteriaceae bacterium]